MNIYESINEIVKNIPAISKEKSSQQGFKYRGIDDVMNTLHPLLAEYKVFVVPQVLAQQREERQTTKGGTLLYSICQVKFTFYAEDGSCVEAITIGEGMDSGDKATNKAMAIAMKYALFQVFCIPTDEMIDPDGEGVDPIEPKPKKEETKAKPISAKIVESLRTEIKNANVENEKVIDVLHSLNHNRLNEILVDELPEFKKALGVN